MNSIKTVLSCGVLAFSVVSCSTNLTSGSTTTKPAVKATSAASSGERAIGERMFSLINSQRAKAGKKPLSGNRGLNQLAQKQASHLSRNAKDGQANTAGSINRAQYAYLRFNVENVTEMANVTSLGDVASSTVSSWMNSPEHRRTMLQSWNNVGIGVSKGAYGRTYVTMLVGVSTTGVPRSVTPIGW